MNIKKGSSIWKLATFWGSDPLSTNFCPLMWRCLYSFLIVATGSILLGLYLGGLVASAAGWVTTGVFLFTVSFGVTIFLSAVITIILVVVGGFILLESEEYNELKEKLANTIPVVAYTSWKDKFCPTVNEVD